MGLDQLNIKGLVLNISLLHFEITKNIFVKQNESFLAWD